MEKLRKGYVMNVGNGASAPETVPFTLDLALLVDCGLVDGRIVDRFGGRVRLLRVYDGLFRSALVSPDCGGCYFVNGFGQSMRSMRKFERDRRESLDFEGILSRNPNEDIYIELR